MSQNHSLSVLMIGNSFSMDTMAYAADIALSAGVKEVYFGNLHIGGCSLSYHATNAQQNSPNYQYFVNKNGKWNKAAVQFPPPPGDTSLATALHSHSWDYVCLQQVSGSSGDADSYNDDLSYMIDYVQTHAPGAKLVWNMTWAYQQDSNHPDFARYNNDQTTMYNAIVSAVQQKICPNDVFVHVIPAGTAVQNSRTSVLGDTITLDGFHMSRPYGRYLVGLMLVKTLTGRPIDNVTFRPRGVTAKQRLIAIESVNNAFATPFAVTDSAYPTAASLKAAK